MGQSDEILYNHLYYKHISPQGSVALLGFQDNKYFPGDCYDLQLENWDINSDWSLDKKYDTIICLRCPYFAEDPEAFIQNCYDNLNDNGRLYIDWGLGDHWRFDEFKVGWTKGEEHEHAYADDNFLWSAVWDDCFLKNEQYKIFEEAVEKFGYKDVKKAIYEETPKVLDLSFVREYFEVGYDALTLWPDTKPQIYFLLCGVKK